MAYRQTQWSYLSQFRPDEAKKLILDAHIASEGNRVKAAKRLDMSYMTMSRLVDKLELGDEITKIRDRFDFNLGRSYLDQLPNRQKRACILRALRDNHGSRNAAAKALNVSFRMVDRAVKTFGLENEVKSREELYEAGAIAAPGRPRKTPKVAKVSKSKKGK